MKILLTNDDGIQASGLHADAPGAARAARRRARGDRTRTPTAAPRRARSPPASRSGSRRSTFGDGTTGFATDGTPVDCVRFAALGLVEFEPGADRVGHQPRRQPRRRHHLLGHGRRGARGHRAGHPGDSGVAAVRTAERSTSGWVASSTSSRPPRSWRGWSTSSSGVPMPPGTLLNVNCPAGEARGARACKLGQAHLPRPARARRRRPTAAAATASTARTRTTTARTARTSPRSRTGLISVTPLHFDLTDVAGVESLAGYDLDGLVRPAAREVE